MRLIWICGNENEITLYRRARKANNNQQNYIKYKIGASKH